MLLERKIHPNLEWKCILSAHTPPLPPDQDGEAELSRVWNAPSLFAQFITFEGAFRPGMFALYGRSVAPSRGP